MQPYPGNSLLNRAEFDASKNCKLQVRVQAYEITVLFQHVILGIFAQCVAPQFEHVDTKLKSLEQDRMSTSRVSNQTVVPEACGSVITSRNLVSESNRGKQLHTQTYIQTCIRICQAV